MIGVVIAGLTAVFLGVLLAVQLGGDASGVLMLPLVFAVPVVAVGLYWLVRSR